MAQAWKKSHTYIRSHNWYADTLELDCSVINLESLLRDWAQQIGEGTYRPAEIRLVPAPKTDSWTYFEDSLDSNRWKWGPKPRNGECTAEGLRISDSKELRPLAHVNIQDQTVATAIMMCLADAVETAQGSTNPEHKHQVCSYGNRLFCDWDGEQAKFRWGNSSTYSQYFQDYQRFLERPILKAQEIRHRLVPTAEIYEIHLDLSAFYDSIDRARLIDVLKKLAGNHYDTVQNESIKFWRAVRRTVQGWTWAKEDKQLAGCLRDGELPQGKGVPQGLVASGFLANAYLLDFDQQMSNLVDEKMREVTVIDYCRYVDDIRLLVWVPEDKVPDWKKWLTQHIHPEILKTTGMTLNPNKTKIERYTAKMSGVSTRMRAIQQAVSGPLDGAALNQMLQSLEGLFSLAEQMRDQNELGDQFCKLPLACVDQPQMDVREDTVMRFAANRITKALKNKRLLFDPDIAESDTFSELDHMHEAIARRFVAVWARNPALVALLKQGFYLFPSPVLLRPVCEALLHKIGHFEPDSNDDRERRIALYCLSEIFRFAALELHRQCITERPRHADWEGFRDLLASYGRDLVEDSGSLFLRAEGLPWYVLQQIYLFFAIYGDFPGPIQHDELDDHLLLHCILRGDRQFSINNAVEQRIPLFIVAYQVSQYKERVVANLYDWLNWIQSKGKPLLFRKALNILALNHPELFGKTLTYGKRIHGNKWSAKMGDVARKYGLDYKALPGELSKYNGEFIPLAAVIMRVDNPFAQENALLTLTSTVLKWRGVWTDDTRLAPHNLKIRCKDWSKIQQAGGTTNLLKLEWVPKMTGDPRYKPPSWLSDAQDSERLYQLGCFLRACATGEMDFSAGHFLVREGADHAYRGLKSSWFKRRIGMLHQPEALNGEAAPMTSWISELLYRLLQWPGLQVRTHGMEWPSEITLDSLKKIIQDRLRIQRGLYGKSSLLPVYVERIHRELKDAQHLRVVMVQTLLPQKSDFQCYGVKLDTAPFRPRHRGHVAAIAKLILDKLHTANEAAGRTDDRPIADLIVFPELSIHWRDVDLLKLLADKTGAMIFAGLVFLEREESFVNAGLWLIPFKNGYGRQWITRLQGKQHMTKVEEDLGIKPWRPYQLVIELANILDGQRGFRLSGSICYDATDISLAADLKNVTNAFIVSALNQDIDTFDSMVDALHYHMYQHVVLVNAGKFGGSVAKAPYKEKYQRRIAHVHGSDQIAISMFDMNIYDFIERTSLPGSGQKVKTKPAGLSRV